MQIIINIVDIKIIQWTVDVAQANVTVDFQLIKDDGTPYARLKAVFWVTMPAGVQEPYWYQLPLEYVTTLTNITLDARTALMGLIA